MRAVSNPSYSGLLLGQKQQQLTTTTPRSSPAVVTPDSKTTTDDRGIQHYYDADAKHATAPPMTILRTIREPDGTNEPATETTKDPPAQMMRSSSLEANKILLSSSATTTTTDTIPPTVVHSTTTQQPHEVSIVNSMLRMVDMSCVATGLVPDEEHEKIIQLHSPSFAGDDTMSLPEWGKPPTTSQQHDSSPVRRQENFELVYQEPTAAERSAHKKSSKLTNFFQRQKAHASLGIAKRTTHDETTTTTTSKGIPRSILSLATTNHTVSSKSSASSSSSSSSSRNSKTKPKKENGFLRKAFQKKQQQPRRQPTVMLHSIKPASLETVPEEDLKVSVPGEPHTILSGKDLIGSEVVEEIYSILEESMEENANHTNESSSKPQSQSKKEPTEETIPTTEEQQQDPNIVVSETTQVVYSSSPKRGGGYQKFESDDDDDDEEQLFTKTTTYEASTADESDDVPRARSWKEKLGLSKSTSGSEHNEPAAIKPRKAAITTATKPMWKAVVDPATGRTYYYHRKTRETTWNKPNDEDLVPPKKSTMPKTPSTAAQQNALAAQNAEIQRLVGLLPPESAAGLTKQYSGQTLIQKLQELVETSSQPFDEPVVPKNPKSDEKSIANKTHAAATIYSGFSSHKSRISDKTIPIKNTVKKTATSQPVVPAVSPRPAIPRNIPVPRLRELEVEEFSSAREERSTLIRGDRNLRNPPRLLGTQIAKDNTLKHPSKLNEDDANYMGDAENDREDDDEDEGDDRESYAATDSISALSEDNLSYIDRKEAYDDARRRALHRAIAQQDWDLAAQMTVQLKERPPAKLAMAPKHAVSEIDRLMAENNWGAVSQYIDNARDRAQETERQRINRHLGRIDRPQKRFGARSQLQHTDLESNLEEEEEESDSTGVSEYTSESDSPKRVGLAPPRARARKPKEFAC